MAIFGGNKEEKKQQKMAEKKAAQESSFERSRDAIQNSGGKYYTHLFIASEFAKTDAMAIDFLYKEIVSFANYFGLDIKHVGKPEEMGASYLGINIIFEKK